MKPDWFPDWSGETALIVGAGPSATRAPLEAAKGRARVIAVNESYRLVPWADALYACDGTWWIANGGVPRFAGLKISRSDCSTQCGADIKKVELVKLENGKGFVDQMLFDEPGVIGWGGNSGFQSINLAAQFGARTIVMVGIDACVDYGLHWHGAHTANKLTNPTAGNTKGWRTRLDAVANNLRDRGITVLNASPISALENYEKVDFAEYFARLAEYPAAEEHAACAS